MLIDTHLHLDAVEFDLDRASVVSEARASGVNCFVLPAVSLASCSAVAQIANVLEGAVCAYGIHPVYVDSALETDIQHLSQLIAENRPVALGEIGLDGHVPGLDHSRQEWFFSEQLRLARDYDLPVLLHVRKAQDRVLKYLRRFRVTGGIAHAFNGSLQQAEAFIDLGFALGFGGAMTYTGSLRIRHLAATLPLDSIVLESDAPDIPPAWAHGARNAPVNVARYAQVLAGIREISSGEVAVATTRAACRVLRNDFSL